MWNSITLDTPDKIHLPRERPVYLSTEERRQDVRASVNIPVDITVQDRFHHGWVKNMAPDGVFVKVRGSFYVGQDISFYFFGEAKIATVIWDDPKGIGVKFIRSNNTI